MSDTPEVARGQGYARDMENRRLPNGQFPPRAPAVARGLGWGGPARGPGDPSKWRTKRKTSQELCEPLVPQAVEVWKSVTEDVSAPPMVRIIAAEKILDRAEGKAISREETYNHNDGERRIALDYSRLEPEEVIELRRLLLKATPQVESEGPTIDGETV